METNDSGDKLQNQPIGVIAVQWPGATAIFRKFKLDYCCGGNLSLAQAAARRGVDLTDVESALAAIVPSVRSTPTDTGDLIDHILSRFHDTHRRELPELILLARRVEKVHADHPDVPKGLAQFLEGVSRELKSHMEKEEQILFPMLRAGHPAAFGPILVMRSEHVDHGEALEVLATATNDMRPPQGACGSWRALYAGLRKLSDDLREHIHTENNILFPRFEH